MPWFVPPTSIILIGAVLAYGAYTDYKQRIIPNKVPIAIMLLGTFTATSWLSKIVNIGLMAAILVGASFISKNKSGGGDIKVYLALSFAIGLPSVACVLAATIIIASITNRIINKEKLDKKTRIPLCTYLAPAYALVMLVPTLIGVFV